MHTNKAQSGSIKVFNVDVSDGDNIVTVFDFLYSSTGMNICPKKSETVYPLIWAPWGILKQSVLLTKKIQCLHNKKFPLGLLKYVVIGGKKAFSGRIGTYSGPILDQIGTFYRYLQQNA